MARYFNDARTDYLHWKFTSAAFPIQDWPCTMAAWAFDDSTAFNDRCIMQCQDTGSASRYFRLSVGNDFISAPTTLPCQIGVSASGANANETASRTSAERVTNRWHHWAGVFAGDASRTAYLDGVVGTENTFTADPFADSTLDSISVGSEQDSSPGDEWSGGILWPAIWNVVLTAEEIGLLARGAHPTTIRPQNLVFFASLDDTPEGLRDLISGKMANFDSNATQAAHGTPLPTRDPMLYRAIEKPSFALSALASPPITDFFYVKRTWTSRPPFGTPLDFSNPLTHKLRSYVTFDAPGGAPYEHVLKEFGTFDVSTNHGVRQTKYGPAYFCTAENDADAGVFFVKHDEFYNNVNAFTCMALARNDKSTGDTWANQEFPWCHGGAGIDGWTLRYDTGNPRVSIYNSTPTQYAASISLSGTIYESTDWLITGGYWSSADAEIVCRVMNLKSSPTATTGTPSVDTDAGNTPWIGASAGGSAQSWQGDVAFGAYWERVLSDEEWNSLVRNPWQIFEPERVLVGVAIDAAGNVVITDVANSGETPGAGSETWNDGSTGNVISGLGFV